jgi:hypothetical protein
LFKIDQQEINDRRDFLQRQWLERIVSSMRLRNSGRNDLRSSAITLRD